MSESEAMNYFIYATIGLGIWVAIAYFFYRWVFDVDKHLANQEKQIQLLRKIAEKQGVQEHEIIDILMPPQTR
jgi:hypothetical protein